MKALCLLWFMKTKASLRNLFKKPSSAIFTIFVVLLYGFIFYAFFFLPKDNTLMLVNFELHSSILIFIGFLALMLFSTMLSSKKALFSGEDAYFLFSGPFHKKQIMTFLSFQTFLPVSYTHLNDAAGHGRGIITHRHHHPKPIESVIS